jgi:putative membrane protein
MKIIWLGIFLLVFIWSAIHPADYFIWFLEVIPALIGLVALALTYPKFKFTTLAYTLILIHCIILMIGGHYTYAHVPLFDWLKDIFDLQRNNYDKVGHFAQGFIPAIISREILIRKSIIHGKKWLSFFVVCFCLALSAFYELIEWWVAISTGESAEAFLGTQGDIWDTQSDMALALLGSMCALLFLSRFHDREIKKTAPETTM